MRARRNRGSGLRTSLTLLLGVALCAAPGCAPSTDDDELTELMLCYGRAADAIGEVRIYGEAPDAAQQARDAGAAIAASCFRDNAVFEYWFPGAPLSAQAAPDAGATPPDVRVVGPVGWAQWVSDVFRGAEYDYTQHALSNLRVTREGATAQVVAYLIGSHFTLSSRRGQPSACADVGMGTYTLDAKRDAEGWLGTRLRLTVLSFDPIYEEDPGACKRLQNTRPQPD